MSAGLIIALTMAGVVAIPTAPFWGPHLASLFPPIYRTPLIHAWEVMVSSIEHRPNEWRLDTYHAEHCSTGTRLWIANGQDFLKVERGPLQGISMPRYHRRRFLKAVRQMRVIEQQEAFLTAWERN